MYSIELKSYYYSLLGKEKSVKHSGQNNLCFPHKYSFYWGRKKNFQQLTEE